MKLNGALLLLLTITVLAQTVVDRSVLDAASQGDEAGVSGWLRSGANVNARGDGGTTALLAAVQGNQPGVVRLLLTAGADVNVRDASGVSALLAGSKAAGPEVVGLLLDGGARLIDVPKRAGAGAIADLEDPYIPLIYIIVKGQIDNVSRVLAAGADAAHKINDRSLAIYASEHDWAAIVDLLDRAARPNAAPAGAIRDPFARGYTPLMVAAAKGDAREFHRLLQAGADWKSRTRSHTTILMFAAQGGDAAIVDTLLRLGATAGASNAAGWTALMYAAVRGDTITVEKLLAAGEDPAFPEEDAGALVHAALSPEVRRLLRR